VLKNVKKSKTCVMAMEIIKCNTAFDFKRLTLANPEPLQSSTYFTKISLENNKPFCIQLPKCQTKQGLLDIKGTKYCDLMYERSLNEELITWLEQLEYACQDKLCEKKELWFQTELSRDDIESMMAPLMRLYQSGKYILIRTSLITQKINDLDKSIAYNEQEVTIDLDKLEASDSLVPLLIIHGIKFSARSFELDIRLAQMLIFDKPTESPCLIKYVGKPSSLDITHKPVVTKEMPLFKKHSDKEKLVLTTEPIVKKPESKLAEAKPAEAKPAEAKLAEAKLAEAKLAEAKLAEAKPTEAKPEKYILKNDTKSTVKPLEVITINTPALEEVSLEYEDITDSISLKKPNEVYYEIYKVAREKAKQLRKVAMEAYLEAKEIKTKYMLSDFDDSDEDSDEDDSDQEQEVSDQEES
jgi:hypothetical protein